MQRLQLSECPNCCQPKNRNKYIFLVRPIKNALRARLSSPFDNEAGLFPHSADGERDRADAAVFEEDEQRHVELARLSNFEIAFILNLTVSRDGNLFVELRTEANITVSGFVHADDAKRQRGRIRDAERNRMFADGPRANVAVAIVNRERLPEQRLLRHGEVEDANRCKQRDGNGSTDSGCGQHEITPLSREASGDGGT